MEKKKKSKESKPSKSKAATSEDETMIEVCLGTTVNQCFFYIGILFYILTIY